MKISYNWLKWYVPAIPDAEKLAEAIVFHAFEVESVESHGEDFILDIKTLPDRNHDCLSHQGIAREVSAILDIPFVDPTPKYKIPVSKPTELKIDIQTPSCRRYIGRIVRNIKVGPSSEWVVKHLESIGQRTINNVVDATNLTMFDCGQPTHIFDLDKIKNMETLNSKLEIRNASAGEKIKLLTGEEKELNNTMTVISDGNGNALAVAGVKGGKFAEVDGGTTDIIIEVANFEPTSVRKTAKVLNIQTDSTKRFENDLSPELCDFAMKEISALIFEMNPEAVFEDIVDIYPKPQEIKTIEVTTEYINKKLGSQFSSNEIENVWTRLNIDYHRSENVFTITQPALRLDLCEPHDLVEEVGRIIGYEKIKPELPETNLKSQVNEIFYKTLAAKKYFIDQGYSEVMTYVFRDKGEVEVLKSASDKKFLRTNLKDGMNESLTLNTLHSALLGIDQIKIFEIGTVFLKDTEEIHVAYNEKKNIIEMTLDEFYTKNNIVVGDSYNELLSSTNCSLPSTHFSPWSSFPFISRDIAVWVPAGTQSDILKEIYQKGGTELLVRDPQLVDTFTKPASSAGGDGKTSYAFRLVFQSFERTLTDEEVNNVMSEISKKILENKDWELR